MVTSLPKECLIEIFKHLQPSYFNIHLFSCILVNRQWCKIGVPLLWNNPNVCDEKFIRTCLLLLNAEEQALLVPFNITLPKDQKPLFEYTRYINSIKFGLDYGIHNWLDANLSKKLYEPISAIKSSLIALFLRTASNLKYLCFEGIIYNKIKFQEHLYKNTTLTSLRLSENYLDFEDAKIFAKILYKNTILTSLNLGNNNIGSEGGKVFAEALCKNITLTSLDLSYNNIDYEGGKAFAEAFRRNTTLTSLNLGNNNIGPEGVKALIEALCTNTTLSSLNLSNNNLGFTGGRALTQVLYKNTTLTTLNLSNNNLGFEGGKSIAEALCINTALTSLDLSYNDLDYRLGKVLVEFLYKNTTLTSLDISYNRFRFESGEVINVGVTYPPTSAYYFLTPYYLGRIKILQLNE